MGKPFIPERLLRIRRMRKARRPYRLEPVFAYAQLAREYADYAREDFLDDLRIRGKRKKDKRAKSPLARYGRFRRMQQLIDLFSQTGDIAYGLWAQRLRDKMTEPYRVQVVVAGKRLEYSFSPLIRLSEIESLVNRLSSCHSLEEANEVVEVFNRTSETK